MTRSACVVCGSLDHLKIASVAEWRAWWQTRAPDRSQRLAIDASSRMDDMIAFVQCANCQLYRVEVMPSAADVAPLYDDYGGYTQKAEAKLRRASRRLRRLKGPGAAGIFLDVGANLGFTSEAARRLGFAAHGIDIDKATVAAGQRQFPEIHLESATAEAFADTGFQADLVTCSEVIEHLSDPRSFVAALARLTKPGGRLYLTTPDAGHWRRPKSFIAWNEVKPPEHLIWFSKGNLAKLLTDSGFFGLRFAMTLKPGIRVTARR